MGKAKDKAVNFKDVKANDELGKTLKEMQRLTGISYVAGKEAKLRGLSTKAASLMVVPAAATTSKYFEAQIDRYSKELVDKYGCSNGVAQSVVILALVTKWDADKNK